MFKKLKDMDITNKRIVLRCDFNVPLKDGEILDDTKIVSSLDTIKYLIDQNCKIVILSHLGKIKDKSDLRKNSLVVVAKRLLKLITSIPEYKDVKVIFSNHTRSNALKEKVDNLNNKEILVIENTRYEDYPSKYESNNDQELAKFWASLGDIFVNDAFATAHRKHASTCGIANYIPSCMGFLMEKELINIDKYVTNAEVPFTVIMGGAKLEDKIKVIDKLLPICNHLLLTGGIANTFLKALNINIGFSLYSEDEELIKKIKDLLLQYKNKIVLPFDAIVGSSYEKEYTNYKTIDKIDDNEIIYDLGVKTINKYKEYINSSKTVFVNGTAGKYEDSRYANGTKELLNILNDAQANVIFGGGDSVSAVHQFLKNNNFTYLCTGGGATLEYIANGTLPALEALKEDDYEVLDI